MTETKNNKKEETKKSTEVAPENKVREFLLNKDVSAESVEKIAMGIFEINRYDDKQQKKNPDHVREPIRVIVDSFGGSIYCGMLLINAIENSDTPIHGYCYSKAMSMGFITFTVCHKRFASPDATLMYHDASTLRGGKVEGIQQSINQTKKVIKRMDAKVVAYTKIKQSKLDRIKREQKDWFVFGDEAVELGLVDELLESKRNKHREVVDTNKK